MLTQDGAKVFMGITLMQKYRCADACRDFQLRGECLPLIRRFGKVSKVVEPAFAHRDHAILPGQGV